jgi:AMP deaminase
MFSCASGSQLIDRNLGEWDKLAKWVINHKLISHNVRWLIQVPRLYEVFKAGGLVNNFEDVVRSKLLKPCSMA